MVQLSSRERVKKALNHQETDRVPIDIGGISTMTSLHKEAYKKLQLHFGQSHPIELSSTTAQSVIPDEFMRRRFKSDCYPLAITRSGGSQINVTIENDGAATFIDEWGIKWRSPRNGLCYDVVGHPLLNCSLEDIEKFNWPDPNQNNQIKDLGKKAKELYEGTDYALIMNEPLFGGVYVPCQRLMGFEDFFIKMMLEPKVVEGLLEKIVEYQIGQWNMILDEAGRYLEAVVLSDDLGTLSCSIMSPSDYREIIKPAHKKIVSFIKSKADVKIIYQCDGAVSEFLTDLIDVGFDALNPVRVNATGMSNTSKLKNEFGHKLTFWGACCESHEILLHGTVDDIRAEVQRRVYDIAPGGGAVLGSIHNIQKDTPVENVIAFYDALFEFGTKYYQNING